MWWWRKVRRADIEEEDRGLFERYGEFVIGSVLAGGLHPRAQELGAIYAGPGKVNEARDWLTERADLHERREDRLETVEWLILIFVLLGVIVESIQLLRGLT
jgi:hypothetical protein